MPVTVRTLGVRLVATATLAAAAMALPAATASAAPKPGPQPGKDYTLNVSVDQAFAGDTADYRVRITNQTGTQQVGSADITIPSQIGVGSVGTASVSPAGRAEKSASDPTKFEVRSLGLAPGRSVDVTFHRLELPCEGPIADWRIVAKQSNDFSGLPGNALTLQPPPASDVTTNLVDECQLDFLAQPAGAEHGVSIRSLAFEPVLGGAVKIRALGANGGDPVPSFTGPIALATESSANGGLSPGPNPTLDGGVLSYLGLSISEAGSYKLVAVRTGYVTGKSRPFPIVEDAGTCNDTTCETATLTGARASVKLKGDLTTGATGHVVLSSNVGTPPKCAGYVRPMGPNEWYEFGATVDRKKTITVNFNKSAMKTVTGGANALEICLSSPENFTAKGSTELINYEDFDDNDTDGFAGLLLDCADAPEGAPCIINRSPTPGGGAIVTFSTPATLSDPRCG
jgi:hypothetical protein